MSQLASTRQFGAIRSDVKGYFPTCLTSLLPRDRRFGRRLSLVLFDDQLVRHVVLVNVTDVVHGLLADVFRHHEFYVAKPYVGIETFGLRLFARARTIRQENVA